MLALLSGLAPSGMPLALFEAQAQAQAQASNTRTKEFIAILDFDAKGGISKDEASVITDRIRAQMLRSGQFQIMERAKMQEIIKEQSFQQSDLCDTTECSVELGRLLAVNRILTGSVSKFGDMYTLSARLMDVEKGHIIFEEYEDCDCRLEDLLTRSTAALVAKLIGSATPPIQSTPVLPSSTSTPVLTPQPRQHSVPQGRISISSEPVGAIVFWNERNMGVTPLTLTNQPPGQYNLRLSANGYSEHQQEVTVNPGESNLKVILDVALSDDNNWLWTTVLGGLVAVTAAVGVVVLFSRLGLEDELTVTW